MTEEEKKEIELEVNRIMNSRQDSFQNYIEKSTKHFIWLVTAVSVGLISLGIYFFGDTEKELEKTIKDGVSEITFAHRIDKKLKNDINLKIDTLIDYRKTDLIIDIENLIDTTLLALVSDNDYSKILGDSVNTVIEKSIKEIEFKIAGLVDDYHDKKLSNLSNDRINKSLNSENNLPKGTIIAWFGDVNERPIGWEPCDGKNGRPDLINRFILGSNFSEMGEKGGNPEHTHNLNLKLSPIKHNWDYKSSKQHAILTEELEKSHMKDNPRITNTVSNFPPYIKLIYLIKT